MALACPNESGHHILIELSSCLEDCSPEQTIGTHRYKCMMAAQCLTLSLRAFSYLAKSLSDLKVELAASHTYLKSLELIGSFQNASQVTVLSCRICSMRSRVGLSSSLI